MSRQAESELAALSDGVVRMLDSWCESPIARESIIDGLPIADLVGRGTVVALLKEIKRSFLAARSQSDGPGPLGRMAAVAYAGPSFWRANQQGDFSRGSGGSGTHPYGIGVGRDTQSTESVGAGLRPARPPVRPPAGTLLALENYRNRVMFEQLQREGFSLLRRERLLWGENGSTRVRPRPDVARAWKRLLKAFPLELAESLPAAPGWDAGWTMLSWFKEFGPPNLELFLAQADAWRTFLREGEYRGVLAGIPWAGELRVAATVALAEGLPFIAIQDGVLSEVGVGGCPPATSALAWGPSGKQWFTKRGLDPQNVAIVGDPYLEQWTERVARMDRAEARHALGLPQEGRIVLAALQNTAPHTLVYSKTLPLEIVGGIAKGVARTAGWHLAIKPHPRLPLVDGLSRLAEGWTLARRYGATLLRPFADIAQAVAACDAYVSDGDTLTVETLSTGRPAILWNSPGHTPPYPDYLESNLPVARTSEELAGVLGALPEVDGRALIKRHLAQEETATQALGRLL